MTNYSILKFKDSMLFNVDFSVLISIISLINNSNSELADVNVLNWFIERSLLVLWFWFELFIGFLLALNDGEVNLNLLKSLYLYVL